MKRLFLVIALVLCTVCVASAASVSVPVGEQTKKNSVPITWATDGTLPAGETHVGEVGGKTVMITGTFSRPANVDAYAANDVVSNNATTTTPLTISNFGRINGQSGYITGIRIATDKKSITPRFRVHFFTMDTATVAADNAQYKEIFGDSAIRLGYYDMPAMTTAADAANSTTSRTMDFSIRIPFKCAASTRNIYVVLETLDAFTPASAQIFDVVVYGELN